jgi:Flp pilus assembly protein TadG
MSAMRRDERGQSLIEAAFVIIFLIPLLAAAVDVVGVFRSYTIMTNASREGARVGVMYPCYSDYSGDPNNTALHTAVYSAAKAAASDWPGITWTDQTGSVECSVTDPNSCCLTDNVSAGLCVLGGPLRVTIVCKPQTLMGNLTPMADVTLAAQTQMAITNNSTCGGSGSNC